MRRTALLLCVVLAACTGEAPQRVRFGLPTAPVTLDPRFATDAVSDRLVRLLYRRLVDFDDRALPVPELAEWQRVAPTRYRFTLRGAAHFSDGSALTAADVAATYRSVLDPATGSPHRASLANIDAITVRDERTLDFELKRADLLFPGTLVVGIMAARDAATMRATRAAPVLSSGRFQLLHHDADGGVLLERRRDGARFEFVTVTDPTVRALKLIGGELDIIQGNLPPQTVAWLAEREGLVAERVAGTTFAYLGFNLRAGPSAQREVRRAVASAIDRTPIIEYLFRGQARPAAAIFTPGHWAAAPALVPPPYDPQAARALLADAGYADEPLVLEYKTSADPFRLRIATVLKAQLEAIGVVLDIRTLDWGTFYGDVRHGRFQVYGLSWVGLKLPDIFRYAYHSTSRPPAGANRGGYVSVSADELIERAERAGDRAERAALYRELQRLLLDDLPVIPLWFEDQVVVRRAAIRGYTTDADGHFDALEHTDRTDVTLAR